jgi:hypothetical protein
MTGIDRDDYFVFVGRERLGRACGRLFVLPGAGDRPHLTIGRVPLRGSSSPLWLRVNPCGVDIDGLSCCAPKLLSVGCSDEIRDHER